MGSPARTLAHAAAFAAAAAAACLPDGFLCREDADCDLAGVAGRCQVNGGCSYPDGACPSGQKYHEQAPPELAGACVEECEPYAYTGALGKVSGVALARGGDVLLAAVTPSTIEALRLGGAGEERWRVTLADTADENSETVARALLSADGDELLVPHTRWVTETAAGETKMDGLKRGPGFARVEADTGALLGSVDGLARDYRALRVALPVDGARHLVAGAQGEDPWYNLVELARAPVVVAWDEKPPSNRRADDGPSIVHAAAVNGSGLVLAGTVRAKTPSNLGRAWLRRVDPGTGAVECECEVGSAGLLALAPAGDGAVYFGGFRSDAGETEAWFGRMPVSCPMACAPTWEQRVAGEVAGAPKFPPENTHDAVLSVTPLAEGRLLVAGRLDYHPWAALHDSAGARVWAQDPAPDATEGAVLAVAVAADERCLVLAGTTSGADVVNRAWARKLPL